MYNMDNTHEQKIKHQIFKFKVPCEIFIDILDGICDITDTGYIFHEICFKRAKFNVGTIQKILDKLSPYYHNSKKKYINNGNTFKGFATIIRQICKLLNIKYVTCVKYMFSKYSIIYNINVDY
jgi:hypothetical protein